MVTDALEVGARVLEREMAAVDAEFVRNEFEKVSREVEASFGERAKVVAEFFGTKVDEVFGAENGVLSRELARLFGEGSSVAVQHQLREVMRETSAKMREDLLRQFSSADGSNPLADFKAAHLRAAREASVRQEASLEAMREQMVALKLELAGLRSEREKLAAVDAEAARGTAKGRPYEEAVAEAVEAIANGMGDDCDAVGDFRGGGGRKGDVLVDIDGCAGASRGRIVFEAKNSRRSRKEALEDLDAAMAQRAADYGVWVVPSEALLPARAVGLREVGGDKLFVVFDPEDGVAAGFGGRVFARAGSRLDGQGQRRGTGRAGAARGGRARAGGDGRGAADQAAPDQRRGRDRAGALRARRHGRAGARAPERDRRARGRGRDRVTIRRFRGPGTLRAVPRLASTDGPTALPRPRCRTP